MDKIKKIPFILVVSLLSVALLASFTNIPEGVFGNLSRDRTPPLVQLMAPTPTGKNGWYNAPVSVRCGGIDSDTGIAVLQASVGGNAWYENAVTVKQDGTHRIYCKAIDRAGNAATTSILINIDKTPPNYQLVTPDPKGFDGWHVSSVPIRVSGAISTEISNWDLMEAYDLKKVRSYQQILLGTSEDSDSSTVIIENSGNYRVYGFVEDIAGNQTQFESTFKMDLIPPEVEIRSPKKFFGKISIEGTVNDFDSGVQKVFLDTGSGWKELEPDEGIWSADWATDELKDGKYLLKARVEDSAGNQAFAYHVATVINHFWPVYALTGIPLSFCLLALLDPRRAAWHGLTKSINKYAHMEKNAMMLGKEIE
jgi:hypothetical protein